MSWVRALLITIIVKRLVNRYGAFNLRGLILLTNLLLHLMLYELLLFEFKLNLFVYHRILLNTHCSGGEKQC
jgi:hypothetical protein